MVTNIVKSKWFITGLAVVAGLILLLLAFWFGMYVGQRRADFDRSWESNYGRIFGQPMPGFFPGQGINGPRGFGDGGIVLKVASSTIVIKGNDNVEKTVVTDKTTSIQEKRSTITASQINPGDSIIVIGEPNGSGQIQAKFIRVFPPASQLNNSTTTDNQ